MVWVGKINKLYDFKTFWMLLRNKGLFPDSQTEQFYHALVCNLTQNIRSINRTLKRGFLLSSNFVKWNFKTPMNLLFKLLFRESNFIRLHARIKDFSKQQNTVLLRNCPKTPLSFCSLLPAVFFFSLLTPQWETFIWAICLLIWRFFLKEKLKKKNESK